MFAARIIFATVSLAVVACGQEHQTPKSLLASHSTQNWSVSSTSQPLSMVAASGACMATTSQSSFASSYCFNSVPAARISVDASGTGSMVAFCVATHLPGMASEAALLVLDSQGKVVSEVTGNGNFQMIDTFIRSGTYTLYVGFPPNSGAQRVTLRVAPLSKFALAAPACNLR